LSPRSPTAVWPGYPQAATARSCFDKPTQKDPACRNVREFSRDAGNPVLAIEKNGVIVKNTR